MLRQSRDLFLLRSFVLPQSCPLFVYSRNCRLHTVCVLASVAVPVNVNRPLNARSFRPVPATKRFHTAVCLNPNAGPPSLPALSSTDSGLRQPVVNLLAAGSRGYSKLRPNARCLTLSAKAIVEASPLYVQPYLRLIRLDRPIGMFLKSLLAGFYF